MIAEKRDQLAALLAHLGTVHKTVPEEVAPPCVVIQGSDPFVFLDERDVTFAGEHVISFDVILLVPLDEQTDNEQATQQLDSMIEQLLATVIPSGWWLDSMGQPQAMLTTSWVNHGQRVTLQTRALIP